MMELPREISTKMAGIYRQDISLSPKNSRGFFKLDAYDKNTKIKNDETNVYTLGENWYFNKWAFLQVNYELKGERGREIDNNALIAQLTLQF